MKIVTLHSAVLLSMILLIVAAPNSVGRQACGYSINTIYVTDRDGNGVRNVSVTVTRKDPTDEYNPHFKEASRVYWNDERKAHVYQHGLCGSHRDLIMKISADGFEPIEQSVDLPLGWQAFAVTLKHKGTNEAAVFKQLTCDGTTICVRTINP